MKGPLVDLTETSGTKNRIIFEAAIMFAHRGYSAVSVRDIARQVNIKPASIYNHFDSKDALFDAIVDNIKDVYLNYYVRLEKSIKKALSFEEVLDCFFADLKKVHQIFIYYGVSLITSEQFRNKKARDAYNNVLLKFGIEYVRAKFDDCVKKKWVKAFDTEALATLFMNSVMIGSLMRTHEDMNNKTACDATVMFASLQRYMLNSVEIIE